MNFFADCVFHMDELINQINQKLIIGSGSISRNNIQTITNPSIIKATKFGNIMNQEQVQSIVSAAVNAATELTRREMQQQIQELTNRLVSLESSATVEEYEEVTIVANVACEESLDIIKSLPEFDGDQSRYISWRQAAHVAYKLFEPYDGSSKHYQAVAIIRNKIIGSADSVLSSFNTVLHFRAIISRLDFTYADKKPIHLIEQEMSTLRQRSSSIAQFYDEVARKPTLLVNKTT